MEYFLNPKLQAKIGIVVLLTFNGFLLHSAVLPALKKAGSILNLSFNLRMLALFSGALSGVSWFYAAMLGVGRPLAWKYSLVELLAAYPVLIVGGFAMMVLLTAYAKNKGTEGRLEQGTWTARNAALA
ncbi:putative membrane protein [Pseudomonas fluorescens]|uniref:Putative membrane protein n=2 Tax=Pseudomonas fluorescens TaxID=294 RepID=A0A0P8XWU0_PSEFL|nr:putative membrane protein [Pseudomonas fluorescens]